jgi:hypothetical protein
MSEFGYRGYGLNLVSQIDLPEFMPAAVVEDPDIRISLDAGALEAWENSSRKVDEFAASLQGGQLMCVSEVAAFHVIGGREIRVGVVPGADSGMVRLYTIGSAMGMALHQRGLLVLHGATVSRGRRARIIAGESGAGKSTLAARLGQAGYAVLGDDTMALWNAPEGGAGKWLWQGSRVFKLWEDSITAMGSRTEGLTRLGNRTDKFYVPNPGPATDVGVELAEILVLEIGEGVPRIEPLDGIHALRALAENTYRPEYIALLGRQAEHFRQCGELTREITVSRLIRPWGMSWIDETLKLVLNRWPVEPAARELR